MREPADVQARNVKVVDACRRHFADRESVTVCDLGTGTGASLRAFADILPERQHWTLVDHDKRNLAAAGEALTAWADTATRSGDGLTLQRGPRQIEVALRVFDFAKDPAAAWTAETNLVTASALLDLASKGWIARLANAVSKQKAAVLATLTFDGTIIADPTHALDKSVAEAFCLHQTRNKGFGPAAGPDAANVLQQSMERLGYKVVAGSSPWRLQDHTSKLFVRTVEGIADAVRETGKVELVDDWLEARLNHTRLLEIGHHDVFASRK
ncbi:MAG: hypothetical protein SFV19_09220 [Rhodospirillaceae bacterium]|nr:hypothetical protein [Rhodospirillaceae bacterium]